jgi:hypothetical protein
VLEEESGIPRYLVTHWQFSGLRSPSVGRRTGVNLDERWNIVRLGARRLKTRVDDTTLALSLWFLGLKLEVETGGIELLGQVL